MMQPQQAQPRSPTIPTSTVSPAAKWGKLDVILFHFYLKTVAVITSVRFTHLDQPSAAASLIATPSSASSPSSSSHVNTNASAAANQPTTPRKTSKWFALEVDEPSFFRPQLELWRHVSAHIPDLLLRSATPPSPSRTSFASAVPDPNTCVPPLIIDVILDTSALDPAKHILMLAGPDGRLAQADVDEKCPPPSQPPSGSARPKARQKQIILESWKITLLPFGSPNAPDMAIFYKRCVAHFRTLYTLSTSLPAYRLRTKIRDFRTQRRAAAAAAALQQPDTAPTTNLDDDPDADIDPAELLQESPTASQLQPDSLLAIGCRIGIGQDVPDPNREISIHQPLGAASDITTSGPRSQSHASSDNGERLPVTTTRVFEPLICQLGALQTQVTFRNQIDFSVEDAESLRTLEDLHVDEDYFRPTVATRRPKSQVGAVVTPPAPDAQQPPSPVSPTRERPLQRRTIGDDASGTSRQLVSTGNAATAPSGTPRSGMPTLPPLPSFTGRPSSISSSPSPSLYDGAPHSASPGPSGFQIAQAHAAFGSLPSQQQPQYGSPSASSLSRSPSVFNPANQSSKPVAGLSSLRRASSLNPGPSGHPSGVNLLLGVGTSPGLAAFPRSSISQTGAPALATIHAAGSTSAGAGALAALQQHQYTQIPQSYQEPQGLQVGGRTLSNAGPPSPGFSASLTGAESAAAFRIQMGRRPSITDRDRRLRGMGSFSSDAGLNSAAAADAGSPPVFGLGPASLSNQYTSPYRTGSLGGVGTPGAGSNAILAGSSVGSTPGGLASPSSGLQRQPLVRASVVQHPSSISLRGVGGGNSFSPSSPSPLAAQMGAVPSQQQAYGLATPEHQYMLTGGASGGSALQLLGPSSLGSVTGNTFAPRSPSALSGRRQQNLSYSSSMGGAGAGSGVSGLTLSQLNFLRSQIAASTSLRGVFQSYAPAAGPQAQAGGVGVSGSPTSPLLRRQSQLSGTSALIGGGGSPRAATVTNTMGMLERQTIAAAASKRSEDLLAAVDKSAAVTPAQVSPGPEASEDQQSSSEPSPALGLGGGVGSTTPSRVPNRGGEEGIPRGTIERVGSLSEVASSLSSGSRIRRRSSALSAFGGVRPSARYRQFSNGSPADDDLDALVRLLDARPSLLNASQRRAEQRGDATISPSRSGEIRKDLEREADAWPESLGVGRLSLSGRAGRIGGAVTSPHLSASARLASSRHAANAPKSRAQIDELLQRMANAVKGGSPGSTDSFPLGRSVPSSFSARQGLVRHPPNAIIGGGSETAAVAAAGSVGAPMNKDRSTSGSGSGSGSGFSLRGGHARGGASISSGGHGQGPVTGRAIGGITSLESLPPPPNYDPGEDETAGRLELAEAEGSNYAEGAPAPRPVPSRPAIATTTALPLGAPPESTTTTRYRWHVPNRAPAANNTGTAANAAAPSGSGASASTKDASVPVGSFGSRTSESSRRDEASVEPATYSGLSRLGSNRGGYWQQGGMRNIDAINVDAAGVSLDGVTTGSHVNGASGAMTIPRSRGEALARHFSSRTSGEEAGHSLAHAQGPWSDRNAEPDLSHPPPQWRVTRPASGRSGALPGTQAFGRSPVSAGPLPGMTGPSAASLPGNGNGFASRQRGVGHEDSTNAPYSTAARQSSSPSPPPRVYGPSRNSGRGFSP
ncbi:autophagy protein 13 [Tilletia horrida]|nr:autophagy protein 13 [Tilletia horrida]